MSTVAQKLVSLYETKQALKQKLIARGAQVSAQDSFASYADKIDEIPDFDKMVYRSVREVKSNALTVGENAFFACRQMTRLELPCATHVAKYAVRSCDSLRVIYLPRVEEIANAGIDQAANLESLIVGTDLPDGVICRLNGAGNFMGMSSVNFYIYVPDALVDDYKEATNWTRVSGRIRGISQCLEEF